MTDPGPDPMPAPKPPRRLLRRLGALMIAAVIALLLAEVVVRLFVPVHNVGPSFTTYDPTYGKRLKRGFSCTRTCPEFVMEFTTNSLGYRGPELRDGGRAGVVVLGDSFTMGFGVDDGEEYPALVRARLDEHFGSKPVPVVNLAMGDNGNGRWLKLLAEEVPGLEPQVVVLQVCGNDFDDNLAEGLYRLGDDGELIELPVPGPSMSRRAQAIIEAVPGLSYSYLVSLLKQMIANRGRAAATAAAESTPPPPADGELTPRQRLTHALIDRAIASCRQRGWPVLMVTVDLDDRLRSGLDTLFAARQVDVIHAPEKPQRPDLYFEVDGHWNADGHAHVAGLVADWLLEKPSRLEKRN